GRAGARAGRRGAGSSWPGQQVGDVPEGARRGPVGVVDVGVQLDGDPPGVARVPDRPEGGGEVDGTVAGDEVVVDARRGDVLQVEVADVLPDARDGGGGVVADAEGVADVEVKPHGGGVDVPDELQELVGGFDEEARLGLDQQQHPL